MTLLTSADRGAEGITLQLMPTMTLLASADPDAAMYPVGVNVPQLRASEKSQCLWPIVKLLASIDRRTRRYHVGIDALQLHLHGKS